MEHVLYLTFNILKLLRPDSLGTPTTNIRARLKLNQTVKNALK